MNVDGIIIVISKEVLAEKFLIKIISEIILPVPSGTIKVGVNRSILN